ncbi:MAG TPA: iron-containing redox enzyme family protein [Novosphingobium sp.]|nr:iron-containing redox enzyme family protein [Novosphingobium sp.]
MATLPLRPERAAGAQFLSDAFQQELARWNRTRLAPAFPTADWQHRLAQDMVMQRLEGAFLEDLRAEIAPLAAEAPDDADQFVIWFSALELSGPGQHDRLHDWLARTASLDEVRWFLQQEAAGEAGFDDLVALTQIKLPHQAKLELARNYWDEMGRGQAPGMHGPMLARLTSGLKLEPAIETTTLESLALANAMTAMAASRRYAWHSVGALGVIELTAPARSALTAAALRRLGRPGGERRYFELHAHLDVRHSEAWLAEAIHPLVAEDGERARAMAEGALIRLAAGARCYARYREHFGI